MTIWSKKILMFLCAFTIFAGAFSFPAEVRASNVAPPTVHAEIVGSLLRIEATDGFYPIEVVFINGRRFNFRVDKNKCFLQRQSVSQACKFKAFALSLCG
jgi:hypothetical protein